MDNKEQIIDAIMDSTTVYVTGVLDAVYRSATQLSVENDYGRLMINLDLLKEIMDSAKENVNKVRNG